MNILVIGGQGFIGHNLVLKLVSEGHDVTVFGRSIRGDRELPGCRYFAGEISEIENYGHILENIDIVYHLVSTTIPKTSIDSPDYDIQSNVVSAIKLLDMCCRHKVKKIIFPSSGGTVYGLPECIPISEDHPTFPICSYGISKLAIEKYLYMYHYLYGLDYQILRISNPYGPYQNPDAYQGAIAVFLGKLLKGEEIEIWGNGTVCRDYIYIDDVVEALYLAAVRQTCCKVLNIGSSEGITLNQLLERIRKVSERELKVRYIESRKIDIPSNVLDISRAYAEIGWKPKTPLAEGLSFTWNWLTNNYNCWYENKL